MTYEKQGRYIVEFTDIPKPREHFIEIGVDERRNNYREVELGFDEERALREAKRCLSCRRCLGCALCWAECKPEAIQFEMADEVIELEADEVIISPGVERAMDRLDRRLGFGKSPNIVTDLQLERMLSDYGPSAGLIIRPFDGEIPSSVAIVQGYESASPQMHKAALVYGINEAILLRRKLKEAKIDFIASDLGPLLDEQKAAIDSLDRIELRQAAATSIDPIESEKLQVSIGANGSEEAKVYDLVVLLTQPQISKDVKELSKSLGLSFSYASLLSGEESGLIGTEKEPIRLVAQP